MQAGQMVAAVHHPEGCTSLVILPSESPSTRREALAVEALVLELLAQPGAALLRCSGSLQDIEQQMTNISMPLLSAFPASLHV